MTWTIYASIAASAAMLLATISFMAARRHVPSAPVLVSIRETKMTLVWAAMLIAVAVVLWLATLTNPAAAGDDKGSRYFVAGMAALCVASTCFILLFTLVKRVYATDDGIVSVSPIGNVRTIDWNEIASVNSNPLSKTVKVEAIDGTSIGVNVTTKAYRQFVSIAEQKVSKKQGRARLEELERRLSYKS